MPEIKVTFRIEKAYYDYVKALVSRPDSVYKNKSDFLRCAIYKQIEYEEARINGEVQ